MTEQDWYFTFGVGHYPPPGRYIVIRGTMESSRLEMIARFGQRWAFQYESAEEAGVEKWGLRSIDEAE